MGQCETCGKPILRQHRNRPGRFCSRACYNASGRPRQKEVTAGQRMVRRPKHPLAPPSGVFAECRLVLYDKIGPGVHACHWCAESVEWLPGAGVAKGALVADHLDWDLHNNDPANLVPSCNHCNAHRTREGDRRRIQPGELVIVAPNGTVHRAVQRTCPTCGKPFLARLAFVRRGEARFCSHKCRRW